MKLGSILELGELKERIGELELTVLAPKLTDFSHIPMIYDWINEFSKDIPDYPKEGSVDGKHRLLFCMMALYSPKSFIDKNFMIRGFRRELSKLYNLSDSHISNLSKNLAFYYKNYTGFRHHVDVLLKKIQKRLDERITQLIQR
jgi:hypothetical protein